LQLPRLTSLKVHRDAIYTLHAADTPQYFFSAAGDGMVVRWNLDDPENGELIARLPNSVYAMHYLPADDLLVVGHNYEGIHLLDWRNKREQGSLKLSAAAVFDIQSADDHLVVGTGDGTVYKIDRGLRVVRQVKSSEKSARTIAINPNTGEIAVGFSDNYIRVFDRDLGLIREWSAHLNSVFTLRYTPDYRLLLSGSRDARLKAWDAADEYRQAGEVIAHMYAINHIDFSPDGKHFVTCSMDKSIKVWHADALNRLKVSDRSRHAGHATSVNKVLWTSHRDQLLSASDDRSISVWQIIF